MRKYTVDEFGTRRPVQNVSPKKKNWFIKPRAPKIWMPRIIKRVFYSEILDRWMSINVTQTTLDLVDDAFGFDNYILKTSEADLRSCLGMRLKRQMLLTLVRRSMCPDDPSKAAEIAKKYQQFVIPYYVAIIEEAIKILTGSTNY
ncbi:39S ribosomal protein L28, mitochondrial [Lamellibrachia satsuma]|nr:39S ribosomal protein L28, mitochondrial [Lamellibrachia satsuma]